jgi:PAS domain S-box-containing protein
LRKKDGEYFWVQTSSKPIFDGDKIVGLRGLIVDIDQRKRAEESLSESEDRYRELFENASDLIYAHDLDGRYISVNGAVEQITGYTPEEVLKLKWSDFVAEDQGQRLEEIEKALYSGEGSKSFEIDVISKDGGGSAGGRPQVVYRDGKPVAIRGIAVTSRSGNGLTARSERSSRDCGKAGGEFFRSLVMHLGGRGREVCSWGGWLALTQCPPWRCGRRGVAENFQYDLEGDTLRKCVGQDVCVFAGRADQFPKT